MQTWASQQNRKLVAATIALIGALSGISGSYAEDARTLPKGRSRLSFTYAKSNGITQQYNDAGKVENITQAYNTNLDSAAINQFAGAISPEFGNLISLLNDTGLRYDASQSGTASGGIVSNDPTKPLLGEALSKGFLGIDVEAVQSQSVIQYMTGVSDRFSVGFMIPIVTNTVKAGAEISKVNNTVEDYQRAFSAMGAGFEPIVSGLQQLDAANIETLQTYALEANGYKRFGSSETTGIGDINFGGRFNYLKTPKETWINSAQLAISMPTGKTRPANAITELDNGSGCWDFATAHVINYTPGGARSPWMISHGTHYTYRLPGKRIMRVRESPSDLFPNAASEENVRTEFASKFWTNAGVRYSLNNVIYLETNYEWYWKGRDTYKGSRDRDYHYLGDLTERYVETLNIGASVSMLDGFMNKQFPMPMDFNFNYFKPMRGRNAPVASFFTLEVAMYF